jgi:SpoVK/Ycf46/Vps4 family AAA+-type ATPase
MNSNTAQNWPEANQRYLMAALAVVRSRLERHVAVKGRDTADVEAIKQRANEAEDALRQAADALPAPSALETLCRAFALKPFEGDLLLLCAGAELDSTFPALCAATQGDPRRVYPTFSLALAALPGAHWDALSPAAPLRRWRMIEVTARESLALSPMRIEERVLHYLAGVTYLDDRLRGLVERIAIPIGCTPNADSGPGTRCEQVEQAQSLELPASQRSIAEKIVWIWSHPQPGVGWPTIQLYGGEEIDKQAIAGCACAMLGLQLHVIRAVNIPVAAAEVETLARLWEREAALSGSALLLDCSEADTAENKRAAAAFVQEVQGMIVCASREPQPLGDRLTIRFPIPGLTVSEQRALWQRSLGPLAEHLNGQLEKVITQFNLGLPGIRAVSTEILHHLSTENNERPESLLWDVCRSQARPRVEDLAQRIEPVATWDEIVLPELQVRTLHEIAAHVRHRTKVYITWGFATKSARGLGISALFTGSSGTGKTMAAEVLANELRLDLYRIDLSQVVSKYIGETEKNLRRVFDAVEGGGAILLFDEADALFGKRSEVKDSHDRYANIEVSYLLQRMESYRGLAILTTNMKQALDPAFMRRIRFIVQFPFPDASQRAEIWRRVFPGATPTNGLNVDRLARLNVAGGNIRNIALNAAFLAADAGESVSMTHLIHAARSEYAKLEKPLTEAEIGGWA